MRLNKKIEGILERFTSKYRKDPNVVGVFLTGSHVHSVPDKHSDLDVCVVLKASKFRERGNTWIDGHEVEYFINPIKQIETYLKEEGPGGHTAHMFANAHVLYKKGTVLDKLIAKCKKSVKQYHARMGNVDVELAKYALDDVRKDLNDAYASYDDFAILAVTQQALDLCLKTFFKVKRTSQDKAKRLEPQLKKLDARFASLYKNALTESGLNKKHAEVDRLIIYLEKKLGGKRSKEWKLRTKVTHN